MSETLFSRGLLNTLWITCRNWRIKFTIIHGWFCFIWFDDKTSLCKSKNRSEHLFALQPPVRIELTTPGLQDQCSNHWAQIRLNQHDKGKHPKNKSNFFPKISKNIIRLLPSRHSTLIQCWINVGFQRWINVEFILDFGNCDQRWSINVDST